MMDKWFRLSSVENETKFGARARFQSNRERREQRKLNVIYRELWRAMSHNISAEATGENNSLENCSRYQCATSWLCLWQRNYLVSLAVVHQPLLLSPSLESTLLSYTFYPNACVLPGIVRWYLSSLVINRSDIFAYILDFSIFSLFSR